MRNLKKEEPGRAWNLSLINKKGEKKSKNPKRC
jgi:hypothetical protein